MKPHKHPASRTARVPLAGAGSLSAKFRDLLPRVFARQKELMAALEVLRADAARGSGAQGEDAARAEMAAVEVELRGLGEALERLLAMREVQFMIGDAGGGPVYM